MLLHPDLDKDDCHCHSRPCRRAVGKGEPKQPRGCKRVRADSSSVSAGLRAADELPRPPIFVSIDEIWAVRYGMLSPQCVPHVGMPCNPCNPWTLASLTPVNYTHGRFVDFEHNLEPWQRGEKLHAEPELEYAVHGRYKMDEAASNGSHGCWWVELKELVRTFGEEEMTTKLDAFETELASERKRAMQRVVDEIAEEDGGAG